VLLWTIVGIGFPLLYSFDDHRPLGIGGAVQAAPRHQFLVGEPVALGFGVTLERATLFLADRPNETASLDAILAGGKGAFVVEGGAFRFDARRAAAAFEDFPAPIVGAVYAGQFETLKLRRSRLTIVLGEDRVETLTNVTAEISNRRRSGLSVQGTADIRGAAHTIDLQFGAPAERRLPTRIPIRLSVKGPLLTGTLDGRLAAGEPLLAQGAVEWSTPDLRRMAQAFGLSVPDGPALGAVKVRGQLDWNRTMITFDKATFVSDSGEATGLAALDLEKSRPTVAATLAFKALDATRLVAAFQPRTDSFPWTDFRNRSFLPLARDVDFDVRLSARSGKAGAIKVGALAATLNIKDGKMLAEIAEIELGGGKGSAQASADVTLAQPRFDWRAKLTGVDAGRLTTYLLGTPVLTGSATVQAEMTAEGGDAARLGASGHGTIGVRLAEGGRLPLDMKTLFATTTPPSLPGWEPWTRSPTTFESLDAKLLVQNGAVVQATGAFTVGDARYEGTGRIDPQARTLDARLRLVRDQKSGVRAEQPVLLDGDLSKPRMAREISPDHSSAPAEPGRPRG
jgi:AsmA protein